jgi:glycosyltransferase involved in cell wall biosynthesis
MKLTVLQLCNKPPYPSTDGGCIAMHRITSGLLKAGVQVKLLTIETHKHPLRRNELSQEYLEATGIESAFVDTRINLVDAFSALITDDSYNVSRFFTPDFDRLLIKTLRKQKFDIIHLESLFMTPYISTIRKYSKGKIVLRSHNLEHMIWQQLASGTRNFPKKTYLKILSRQLKKYETSVMNSVDGIAAITREDVKKYLSFKCNKPLVSIPFGIDIDKYPDSSEVKSPVEFFHLGAMDWEPNVEGMKWFLEKVWPLVLKNEPTAILHLAGRNMPEWVLNGTYTNVRVQGEVDDAIAFMRNKAVMIVPLLTAGGIRVKILEAMALGKCVISTSIGANGISYLHNENILVADTAAEFAKAMLQMYKSHEQVQYIGKNARTLSENMYDNKLLTRDLINFYYSLIH